MERVPLIGNVLLVLIVELLDSAIEAVVDRGGKGRGPLAGQAKAQGSVACRSPCCCRLLFGCQSSGPA